MQSSTANLAVSRQPARSLGGSAEVINSTKLRLAEERHGSVTTPSHTGAIVDSRIVAIGQWHVVSALGGELIVTVVVQF